MTYREIVYGVITHLRKNTQHSDITPAMVLFWTQVCINEINARSLSEFDDNGDFLAIFEDIPVHPDGEKRYIDLPCTVLNLDNQSGVEYVAYDHVTGCCKRTPAGWTQFSRTTPAQIQLIYWDQDEKPSSTNPYFYTVRRVNDVPVNRLYLLGLEGISNVTVELGLYCAASLKDVCDLDDPVPVKALAQKQLLESVIRYANYMYMIPKERRMDMEDESEALHHRSRTPGEAFVQDNPQNAGQ